MDCKLHRTRERNPRDNASWFSIVTYFFAVKIFQKFYGGSIQEDQVYKAISSFRSEKLGDNLEKEWKNELKRGNVCFLKPIFRIFWIEYFALGFSLIILETAGMIGIRLLIAKVVSYFSLDQDNLSFEDALISLAKLVAVFGSHTIYCNLYQLLVNEMTMKVKIACSSLIYRKCLKLNSYALANYTGGKVVTLITKDIMQFDYVADFVLMFLAGVVEAIIMMYIMYKEIGISALLGASLLLILLPLQVYLGKKTSDYRLKTAKRTDQRLRITEQILTAIRIIKMYCWELFFSKCVKVIRKKEIRNLRILLYIKALSLAIGQLSSRVAFYICVMAYIAFGNHITPEKAFIVTGCFDSLRSALTHFMPLGIAHIAELHAAVQRITSFLLLDEVPDNHGKLEYIKEEEPKVCVESVTVKSDKGVEILKDINLELKQGLTVLTGPTGSGKSTFLKLLLGDMKKTDGIVDISGKMSYASQEPWIFPGNVKQNIVFGECFDKERYETTIKVCALKNDLEVFSKGDETFVTDRGLNLSRGQKARINLARAVYRKAEIYLFDDCLSAVDTIVGKQIFGECLKGFLKDKICVLVTHQSQVLREVENVVVFDHGYVTFQGNYTNFKEDFKLSLNESENEIKYKSRNDKEEENIANDLDKPGEGTELLTTVEKYRNVYEETKEEGAVNKAVYYKYFSSGGGIKMFLTVISFSIIAQATTSWADYFVSFWVDMEQTMSGFRFNGTTNTTEYEKLEDSHASVMKTYSFVILAAVALTFLRAFTFFMFTSKASTNIHNSVFENILNAGMVFFDVNLSGNVLNRFSRDLGIIDEQMTYVIFDCIQVTLTLLAVLLVVSSVNLFFIVPSTIFIVILLLACRIYLPVGRSIRRLEGITRSPVVGHINATLEGLTTIRASQVQEILRNEFDRHQDLYNSVAYLHLATTRGFAFYIDIIRTFYITVVTSTVLFFRTDTLAGKVGLAITQSFSLTDTLQWGVCQWAELENQMTATERILEYTKIQPEDKAGDKPTSWPNHGRIIYSNVNLTYPTNSERILKGVDFVIEPKQKVGIVGRTGAGKSSLISLLFRLYEFRGRITIDGVDIKNISAELLRTKITIIPQDPVLFSGTIRNNIDPYGQYSDNDIWNALEEVEMMKLVHSLNVIISEGGFGFSIGERQLLCLARAIIDKHMILVLDEATANVDPQTDTLIQRTIKRKFSDCTVVTIAHRLHTIMDSDRVLVMDSGNVVEYDDPNILLRNTNGIFYNMVKEAGLLCYCS